MDDLTHEETERLVDETLTHFVTYVKAEGFPPLPPPMLGPRVRTIFRRIIRDLHEQMEEPVTAVDVLCEFLWGLHELYPELLEITLKKIADDGDRLLEEEGRS
jgi:hypothetical protein